MVSVHCFVNDSGDWLWCLTGVFLSLMTAASDIESEYQEQAISQANERYRNEKLASGASKQAISGG